CRHRERDQERPANQHQCLPVRTTDEGLILAMVNPLDLLAIEDVERTTNRKVEIVVVTPSDIKEAIAKYYWEPE
nr:type II secretion system protein GspE [Candidatus Hydrogenedentota bacterium]